MSMMRRLESALRRGRRAAESLMTDEVLVQRKSSTPVTDPDSAAVTYPLQEVYAGKGRIQDRLVEPDEDEVAGASIAVADYRLQVPITATIARNDIVTITASATDPLMIDRQFRIVFVARKTHATKLRAGLEEII